MTVTVIICTRNRADSLSATLQSIGRTTVPPQWHVELLVVDNGSTDNTCDVVNASRLPNLAVHLKVEPRVGQSAARNLGLVSTSAEVILFTDDDVRVPQGWLLGMCGPIFANDADAVAGGVTFPNSLCQALSDPIFSNRRTWFASTETLDPANPDRMVGANMAFHRKVLEKVRDFNTELGPGALGFGDDTLFSKQLKAANYRLVGALDIAVEHHFDASRLTYLNILSMARRMGRSDAYIFRHWSGGRSRLVVPRLLLARIRKLLLVVAKSARQEEIGAYREATIKLELELAFYQEYLVQRKRPLKYRVIDRPSSQLDLNRICKN